MENHLVSFPDSFVILIDIYNRNIPTAINNNKRKIFLNIDLFISCMVQVY